jgi:predicted metal-binding membrane protein
MSNWMLMVVAMMFPLVLDSVRRTAARSLWTRRHRAIAGFLLGYLSLWAAVGVLASFIPAKSAAAGFALAAIWQLTPMKSRAVLSCHRTMPLTPTGWRADLDCIRFGWHIGGGCLISCWALMLACVLSGHALFAMVAITAAAITERYATQIAPGLICAALSLCAVGYVLVN